MITKLQKTSLFNVYSGRRRESIIVEGIKMMVSHQVEEVKASNVHARISIHPVAETMVSTVDSRLTIQNTMRSILGLSLKASDCAEIATK